MADNRLVTENFLRLNFSPKPGITPDTNDSILMDCDQITARYYVSIAGVSSTGKRLPSQNQLSDSITLPTVSTGSITAITATTATGSGTVSSDGGATVTDRGIQWSLYSNFSVIAGSASGGSGTGSFTANMTGLTPGTTYYVRAYATNSVGIAISYNMSFTTTAVPIVSTYPATAIGSNFVTYNGSVDSDSGSYVTIRGFLIILASKGTPSLSNYDTLTNNGTGIGSYSTSQFLTSNTSYAYRAYATNANGTGYGAVHYFTTLP